MQNQSNSTQKSKAAQKSEEYLLNWKSFIEK